MTLVPSTTTPPAMDSFFQSKTAVFSKKVSAEVLFDWRISPRRLVNFHLTTGVHGGKLFYETTRRKDERPDYYFTCSSHKNFYQQYVPSKLTSVMADCSEGAMVLSVDWIADSLDAQRHVPCKFYIVNGITRPSSPWGTHPPSHIWLT
jgi:hypothetical protein